MDPIIIPNVEFSTEDIASKAFFRNTKKISLKVSKAGITFTGINVQWDEITVVSLKYFNCNPYFQLDTKSGAKYSLFFENKFYYRKKAPWFGASEFISKEFVKILQEKNLFSLKTLEDQVSENSHTPLIHQVWNTLFLVFPVLLVVLSVIILYSGFVYGYQIHKLI